MDENDQILSEPVTDEDMKAFFDTLIDHPFLESEEEYPITMALMFSEGRTFMGGIYGVDAQHGELLVNMQAPLMVRESLVQDPKSGAVHPQVEFMPASFSVGLMDSILVKASMLYQLKATSKTDQGAVSEYKKKYENLRMLQAGITPPSMSDIANLKNVIPR